MLVKLEFRQIYELFCARGIMWDLRVALSCAVLIPASARSHDCVTFDTQLQA